jgi:flagellar biosynthesis/type III secretory pathway M-ring protein FliF/YscJ
MPQVNTIVIVIVGIIALGILCFTISRNRKDKKELESEGMEDPVEEAKTDQERRGDKV